MQGLGPVAGGPPQRGRVDEQRAALGVEPRGHLPPAGVAGAGHFDLQGKLGRAAGEVLQGDGQLHVVSGEALLGVQVLQAALRAGGNEGGTVNAAHHQAGPPVPAGVALDLAQQVAVRGLHGVGRMGDGVGQAPAALQGLPFGRAQADLEQVLPRVQRLSYLRPHGHEQARAGGDQPAVEQDLGDRVHAVQVQERPPALQEAPLHGEAPAEQPVAAPDPLEVELPGSFVRVGDQAGLEERGDVVPRDAHGHGTREARGFLPRLPQLPFARQVDSFHYQQTQYDPGAPATSSEFRCHKSGKFRLTFRRNMAYKRLVGS